MPSTQYALPYLLHNKSIHNLLNFVSLFIFKGQKIFGVKGSQYADHVPNGSVVVTTSQTEPKYDYRCPNAFFVLSLVIYQQNIHLRLDHKARKGTTFGYNPY